MERSLFSLPLAMLDRSQGQPEEVRLLGHLWETKLSSPGQKSCEATTDPGLHLCGVLSEIPSVQLIPTRFPQKV